MCVFASGVKKSSVLLLEEARYRSYLYKVSLLIYSWSKVICHRLSAELLRKWMGYTTDICIQRFHFCGNICLSLQNVGFLRDHGSFDCLVCLLMHLICKCHSSVVLFMC